MKVSEFLTSVTAVEALVAACADVAILPVTNEVFASQRATRVPSVSPGSRTQSPTSLSATSEKTYPIPYLTVLSRLKAVKQAWWLCKREDLF